MTSNTKKLIVVVYLIPQAFYPLVLISSAIVRAITKDSEYADTSLSITSKIITVIFIPFFLLLLKDLINNLRKADKFKLVFLALLVLSFAYGTVCLAAMIFLSTVLGTTWPN